MVAVLLVATDIVAQQAHRVRAPEFMGRKVTITEAETDEDGLFPKGPASICLEGPPERQCYTAPKDFGRAPSVEIVPFAKEGPALLFSAASGGVSGFGTYFALLRPRAGKDLQNLFLDISVSNQSQHVFWNDSSISDAPIFVTADFEFGPSESHYSEHRYTISAYTLRPSSLLDDLYYWLDDRYLTVRKYDLDANEDILSSERKEILSRLRRVKAEAAVQKPTTR